MSDGPSMKEESGTDCDSKPPPSTPSHPSAQVPTDKQSGLSPSKSSSSRNSSVSVDASPAPRESSSSDSESSGQAFFDPSSAAGALYFLPTKNHDPSNPISPADIRTLPTRRVISRLRPAINPLAPKGSRIYSERLIYPFSPTAPYLRASLRSDSALLRFIPHHLSSYSVSSSQGSSATITSESRYPSVAHMPALGILPCDILLDRDEDWREEPEKVVQVGSFRVSQRGIGNLVALLALTAGIIALFVIYPVLSVYRGNGRNAAIVENASINSTGQAVLSPRDSRDQMPFTFENEYIDSTTPPDAFTKQGKDGTQYELVFSDEFGTKSRHLGRNQNRVWLLSEGDVSPTLQGGYLILDRQSHFRTLYPHCLDHGFIEVSFIKDTTRWQGYWTGEWYTAREADASDAIPMGISLGQQLLVTLHIGSEGDSHVALDYIRLYQKKPRGPPCDITLAARTALYLEFD